MSVLPPSCGASRQIWIPCSISRATPPRNIGECWANQPPASSLKQPERSQDRSATSTTIAVARGRVRGQRGSPWHGLGRWLRRSPVRSTPEPRRDRALAVDRRTPATRGDLGRGPRGVDPRSGCYLDVCNPSGSAQLPSTLRPRSTSALGASISVKVRQ